MTLSPFLTSTGIRFSPSSSHLPSPTATTSPIVGFSFAVSGSTMPLVVFSSSATALMITRSSSGLSFMQQPSSSFVRNLALSGGECYVLRGRNRFLDASRCQTLDDARWPRRAYVMKHHVLHVF